MPKNFLYWMAIGDAFGMKYEFVERTEDIGKDDLAYGPHPSFKEYQPAHYTDDTQMSLANAELLSRYSRHLDKITDDMFISHWLAAFERDPRRGYSTYMHDVMQHSNDPADFKSRINAKRGTTGGAAMRAAPFGFLPNVQDVKRLTIQQAKITHDTPDGINSALAVALSVHYLRQGGPRHKLKKHLQKQLGKGWNAHAYAAATPANNGIKIVTQALDALSGAESLSDILIKAVNKNNGGDTDTICALAMAMAAQTADIKDDLPVALKFNLEDGKYGQSFLQRFDAAFAERFKPVPPVKKPHLRFLPRW